MKNQLVTQPSIGAIEKILIQGDLAPMSDAQRLTYVKSLCKALGISILFRPFDFIKFDGKIQLYANRACTDQLRKKHKISIKVVKREFDDGLYIVTTQAELPSRRTDEAIGAINVKGLQGIAKANALMKGETKSKRRVTLSIMGLGMLDETEIQDAMEKEAKIAREVAIEETAAKLEETTTGRPEFETAREVQSVDTPAPKEPKPPEDTAHSEYRVKSIKAAKGKTLKQIPLSKLVSWLKSFDELKKEGKPLSKDVELDAFYISEFLEAAATAKPGGPLP